MSSVWIAIAVLTVVCFAIKAVGPVALGGRELVLDARVAGVAAAIVAIALRASVLVVLLVAALTAAGLRAIT